MTKPAWPMLWIYPIEDTVGIKGIVWAAVAIFALLPLVPLLDRGPVRSPRRRMPMMIGGAVVVSTIIALIVYAASETIASLIECERCDHVVRSCCSGSQSSSTSSRSAWRGRLGRTFDADRLALLVAAPASAVCVAATLVAGRTLIIVSRSSPVGRKL